MGCNNKATVKEVDADTHKVEVTISKFKLSRKQVNILKSAIASGKPDIVTIARDKAKQNRAKSLRGVKTKPKLDRDEWPMAMFKEGGKKR